MYFTRKLTRNISSVRTLQADWNDGGSGFSFENIVWCTEIRDDFNRILTRSFITFRRGCGCRWDWGWGGGDCCTDNKSDKNITAYILAGRYRGVLNVSKTREKNFEKPRVKCFRFRNPRSFVPWVIAFWKCSSICVRTIRCWNISAVGLPITELISARYIYSI